MDSRRVAGFTCGAPLGISLSQRPDLFSDFIIEREQIFEFPFAFDPTGAGIYVFMQPFNVAGAVFRVDSPAMGQFAVQNYSGFVSALTDEYPIACLVDFAEVSVVQVGVADD